MADYHVGCGAFGIYAGKINKRGDQWTNKTEVTDEALAAVTEYIMRRDDLKPGETAGIDYRPGNGTIISLRVSVKKEEPQAHNPEHRGGVTAEQFEAIWNDREGEGGDGDEL